MTLDRLKELCQYWQKKLRIEQFDITVRFAELMEMSEYGKTIFSNTSDDCLVVICPNHLAGRDTVINTDEEVTLVHELLHVREVGWAASNEWRKLCEENNLIKLAHESGIDRVAEALVSLRRETEKDNLYDA